MKINVLQINEIFYRNVLLKFPDNEQAKEGIDLMRAINTFREYKSVPALLQRHPELKEQEKAIYMLWDYLSGKTNEEIAEYMMECIHAS
jgi:hypothetical protein